MHYQKYDNENNFANDTMWLMAICFVQSTSLLADNVVDGSVCSSSNKTGENIRILHFMLVK